MKEVTITKDRYAFTYNATDEIIYHCPVCEAPAVERGFNYCPNCGVKIKWDLKK